MGQLVLLRHGQSVWNKKNLFTGWVDIPLSPEGIEEALRCGQRLKKIPFDVIFVSTLVRATLTAMIAMSVHESGKIPCIQHDEDPKLKDWSAIHDKKSFENMIPVYSAWQLNERYYGDLQGLDKDECRVRYGADQVKVWRRSYKTPPPHGESLEMTAQRCLPYFKEKIQPYLESGKNVLISAHGNSLRSIVMFLDNLTEEQVLELEIPTGQPICYRFEKGRAEKDPDWNFT